MKELVENSLDAGSTSIEVKFSTSGLNGFEVSDNGKGIDLTKYGDSLFGLHKTFHNHPEAKGVGLFLTKTQIETLGGSISATSKLDQGTTFTIQF